MLLLCRQRVHLVDRLDHARDDARFLAARCVRNIVELPDGFRECLALCLCIRRRGDDTLRLGLARRDILFILCRKRRIVRRQREHGERRHGRGCRDGYRQFGMSRFADSRRFIALHGEGRAIRALDISIEIINPAGFCLTAFPSLQATCFKLHGRMPRLYLGIPEGNYIIFCKRDLIVIHISEIEHLRSRKDNLISLDPRTVHKMRRPTMAMIERRGNFRAVHIKRHSLWHVELLCPQRRIAMLHLPRVNKHS